jgi:serine/threonine-protein kinase RsbW
MQNGPALIDGSPDSQPPRRFQPRQERPGADMDDARSDIRLSVLAHAENVVLIRRVVGALAEALGYAPALVEDIRLAVTEACTNVVRHAYVDRPGSLDVAIAPGAGSLTVVVTDQGSGLQPRAHTHGAGLGLPLMAALSQGFEIDHTEGRGSRVRMQFRLSE